MVEYVNICVIKLNRNFDISYYLNWFTKKTQEQITSYHDKYDQIVAFSSQLLQRYYIASRYNIPPSKLIINYTKYKKPYLVNQELKSVSFNVSHCNDYVVLAICDNILFQIGVDIEKIVNNLDDINELKKIPFSSTEQKLINDHSDFFKLWTKKESLIKAYGCGFATNFYQSTNLNIDNVECRDSYSIFTKKLENYFISVCLYKN